MHYGKSSCCGSRACCSQRCAASALPPIRRRQRPRAVAEGIEFFETHIRPVLVEKCYECHSADAKVLQGGLRLDTAERMRAGGDSGPVIVPNKPDESR